jgi:hypothetical protein
MHSPTKSEPASPPATAFEDASAGSTDGVQQMDETMVTFELETDPTAPRKIYSDMVPDDDVTFTVAIKGSRTAEHEAARERLLTSMRRSVAEAIPCDALAWVRAIEDALLEEIEGLQDEVHASRSEIDHLHTKNEREKQAFAAALQGSHSREAALEGKVTELLRHLRIAQARIQALGRATPQPAPGEPAAKPEGADTATLPTARIFTPVPPGGPSASFAPRYQVPPASDASYGGPPAATDGVPHYTYAHVADGGFRFSQPPEAGAPRFSIPPDAGFRFSQSPEASTPRFSIKPAGLPTFDGKKQDLEAAGSFINNIQRYFESRALQLGCTGPDGHPLTNGWSTAAILQLRGTAARWVDSEFPRGTYPDWETFTSAFIRRFTPADATDQLKLEWENLSIKKSERAVAFNDRFREMRSRLDSYAPLPADRLLDAYRAKIQANREVAGAFNMIATLNPSWSLDQFMNYVASSDAIQHRFGGSGGAAVTKGSTSGPPSKSTLKKMDDKGSTVTSGNEMICYKCQGKGHPARNCPVDVAAVLRELSELKRKNDAQAKSAQAKSAQTGDKGRQTKSYKRKPKKTTLMSTRETDADESGAFITEEDSDDDVDLSESGKADGDH